MSLVTKLDVLVQLTSFCLPSRRIFVAQRLSSGRSGSVIIGGAIVLQQLVHRLQGLVVLVQNLQVLNRSGCFNMRVREGGKVSESSTADNKNKRHRANQRRTQLPTGIEQKA